MGPILENTYSYNGNITRSIRLTDWLVRSRQFIKISEYIYLLSEFDKLPWPIMGVPLKKKMVETYRKKQKYLHHRYNNR